MTLTTSPIYTHCTIRDGFQVLKEDLYLDYLELTLLTNMFTTRRSQSTKKDLHLDYVELTVLTNLFTIGDGLSTQRGHPFGLFKELIVLWQD